jgi:hypothetical protein
MTETLTSISRYNKDNILKDRTSSSKERTSGLIKYCYTATGSLNIDNACSIELMRLSVRQRLNNQFQLRNDVVEIDFLIKNPEILTLVFEIRESIVKKFETFNIALELHSESSDWETLFIVVSTNAAWEKSNAFVNQLFKKLFKTQPETANKINLIIAPDAI